MPNAKQATTNLLPRSIELHLAAVPMKAGHATRVRVYGGKVSRITATGDSCRIVEINLGNPEAYPNGNPAAWALADELLQSYPRYKQSVVIFRGCEDAGVSATVVQYVTKGTPIAIAYGRYCASTTERFLG